MFANKTQPAIKKIRIISRYVLGTLLFLLFSTFILLNIPYVQQKITVAVAEELSSTLNTEVKIKRINAGLLNRIIIDDLEVQDQSGKEMIKVSRLSAKYDILPLFQGKISIGSVQLFGFNIQLNKETPESDLNLQFVIDAFSSTDSIQKSPNLDLRINSLLIRRGTLAFDVNSVKETPGKFNPRHIKLYNILGNISLKALRNDSINAQIKRFSVDEQSGLELRKLSMKVLGTNNKMTIENFEVDMPGTTLKMDTIKMNYDSLGSFNNFVTDVNFSFRMLPSNVTLQDIAPFVPVFDNFKERLYLEMDANGTIDQLKCPRLFVRAGNQLRISGEVEFQDLSDPENAFIFGKLSNLSANREGIDFIFRNFSKEYSDTPPILRRLGNVAFNGEITGYFTDLVTYGTLRTDLGSVVGDVKFTSDRQKGSFSYSGGVRSEKFQLGEWLANNKLGSISYGMNVSSSHTRNSKYPNIALKGGIQSVEYSGYEYNNIELDGEYKNGGFDGTIKLDDENGLVFMNGQINLSEKVPVFNFYADLQHFRPHELQLTKDYEGAELSLKMNANFTGGNIDDMIGSIDIDSILYTAPVKHYYVENINITASNYSDKNVLSVNSELLDARIEGRYSYRTLPNSIKNLVSQYLPSVFPLKSNVVKNQNNFKFDVDIYNLDFLSVVFDIPVTIYKNSEINGYFNDYDNALQLNAYFPEIRYGNNFIEKGSILFNNADDNLNGNIRLTTHRKNGSVNFAVDVDAKENNLHTQINWGNDAEVTYSGHMEAMTTFVKPEEDSEGFHTLIDIKPTEIILNDTVWNIHKSQIDINKNKIHVDKFLFSRGDQFLEIDGYASDDLYSTLSVRLKDINIGYVFDILNLRSIDFQGMATGTATAQSLLKNPVMNTELSVKGFKFNDAYLGELEVSGEWDAQQEGIYLKANIKEKDIADNYVNGYIFPLKPKSGLDLNIKANNANLEFLKEYLDAISPDVTGRVSGNVRLYGGFSSLNIVGKAKADMTLMVDVLNTYFHLNDSIRMTEEQITFDNVHISDLEGHNGTVNGYLRHKHFKNLNYRFQLNANNMLVMNTNESPDMPFYGKIYGTGNALLRGDLDALTVDAAITTNKNTTFAYTLAESASAVSNQFIKFVDKTPGRSFQDSLQLLSDFELAQQQLRREELERSEMDIRLNIAVDANNDANVRIIMDPISEDYIAGNGTGNIRAEYYNKGDIRMFGNYNINQGIYKFSLQEVIRKDFIINQGSNIVFNGNPTEAIMDIQAIYTVNSASLSDLIPDNPQFIKRNNVRVNCLMNLSGVLYRPTITLGIELPNEREEIQQLVNNYVSTQEEVNMQILYLLGIGKFYTPTNMASTQNSNVMTSVLSSTLSGQLNNVLSQFLENKNWNFGTNLSTGERGWTDFELEGVLSAQLLNNRLLINGNFGYRDNPLSETNFVGDFDAQWLLIPSGDLRLKAYNQTNDRYFTRSNLTTQGIGILFKKDFDRWGDLFLRRRNKQKKENAEANTEQEQTQEDTSKAE